MASNGMVNSATTRMLDTVRNLLYIGKWSINQSVSHIILCPHESITVRIVTANNAHFMGPFTIIRPRMNSANINAPTYTGPLVPGWSPKY